MLPLHVKENFGNRRKLAKGFHSFFARLPYARCIKIYWPNPPTGGNYMLLISFNNEVHISNKNQDLILRFMLREIYRNQFGFFDTYLKRF